MAQEQPSTQQKQVWIEWLRVFSALAVVSIHITAGFYKQFGTLEWAQWWVVAIVRTLSDCAVPLFIMIAGALVLGRDEPLAQFYRKRLLRVVPALLFWSAFYIAFVVLQSPSLGSLLWLLVYDVLVKGAAFYHLWFLPMYLMLMFLAPYISAALTGRAIERPWLGALILFLGAVLGIRLVGRLVLPLEQGQMQWVTAFAWYLVYFLGGYWLSRVPVGKVRAPMLLAAAACVAALCVGSYFTIAKLGIGSRDLFLHVSNPLSMALAATVFMAVRAATMNRPAPAWLHTLAPLTLGIYLVHPFYIELTKLVYPAVMQQGLLGVGLLYLVVVPASVLTIAGFRRVKLLRAVS